MNKKALVITLVSLAVVGGVGAAAALTKGFNFSNNTETVQDNDQKATRTNYRSFNFVSDSEEELDFTTLIPFLNSKNKEEKEVFGSVISQNIGEHQEYLPCIDNVYQDKELGITLGDGEELGYFSVKCVDGYKFNRIRIEAINYNRFDEETSLYEKEEDGSILVVNRAAFELKAIDSDSEPDTSVKKVLKFETSQNELTVISGLGRPCILNLELWME